MEVILDSSFIISCVRKKIDFLSELEGQGFKVVVPREVLEELKDLKRRPGESHSDREAIDLAFQMMERGKVKKMKLGSRGVDEGLIGKGKEGVYIATLDRGIQRKIPNRVIIKNAEKTIGIERS
jgi:rRNA-processing protein FCF1